MFGFGTTKVVKGNFYGAKKPIKIWDVNFDNTVISKLVDNLVISKLVKTTNKSEYLIGYLDEVIKPLVLILPQMSGYVKTSKEKGGDKNKNNKLMSLHIDDDKLMKEI